MHASGSGPPTQGYIEIEIPAGLSIEEITQDDVPHSDLPSIETARALGDRWYDERSTPVLIVPSIVTRVERNVLINQEHPDFLRIQVSQLKPVRWDRRLWLGEALIDSCSRKQRPSEFRGREGCLKPGISPAGE